MSFIKKAFLSSFVKTDMILNLSASYLKTLALISNIPNWTIELLTKLNKIKIIQLRGKKLETGVTLHIEFTIVYSLNSTYSIAELISD